MYFKIQNDQPRITQNALKSPLCPEDDLVNNALSSNNDCSTRYESLHGLGVGVRSLTALS